MKFVAVVVAALSFPLSLAAQSAPVNEVGAFASVSHFDKTTMNDPEVGADVSLDFDEQVGYGVSYNRFWTDQLSTEFTAQKLKADMELSVSDGSMAVSDHVGDIDLTAFTGTAQWHFARQSRISPYVGAGLAYVQGEVDIDPYWSGDPLEEPVAGQSVDLESETTWLANAGVNFNVMPSLSIGLDAKYISYNPKGEGDADGDRVDINPLVVAAGVKFRF